MTLEEYKNNKNKKDKNYLGNLLTRSLLTVILVFGVLIMVNFDKDLKGKIEKYLFTTNHNFSKFNSLYNKYFANIKETSKQSIAVFNEKDKKEKEVTSKYKDGVRKKVLKNEDIKLLNGGVVVFIGEKKGYGNTIIVQQSNGIDAWYGHMGKVNVKLYDYIESNTILGKASDYIYLVFQKDGKFIDYEEIKKQS